MGCSRCRRRFEDCITASKLLSQPPYSLIDPKRIVIRGRSAAGLAMLNALSNSSDARLYATASSMYGVIDLVGLMRDTRKLESHDTEPFEARFPINYVDKIDRPLLSLQGENDRMVPKEQAEVVYASIKKRGGIVEYKPYPGEGHGFRMKETQRDALERELGFYQKVLGLQKADRK